MNITYPPELLPSPDDDDEVEVVWTDDDGTERMIVVNAEGKPNE